MHITLNEHITPGFILYQTPHHFLIQTQPKTLPSTSILAINRLTSHSQLITQKSFFDLIKSHQPILPKPFWAIYGLITIDQIPYLTLVKSAKLITSSKQTPIYQIKDLNFIQFQYTPFNQETPQQRKILDSIITQIVQDKFYFSYTQDLTQSFKKNILNPTKQQAPDPKYFWNLKNLQFLQTNHIQKPWLIPIIQGYVASIQQNQLEYRIIARRSKHMSGTRYNNRGVDSDGFASNYVQIEQRIEHNKMIFTFLQLRGSAPIFWREQGGLYGIEFPYPQQKCYRGLKKHYDELINEYQCTINTINLLSDMKEREKSLSQVFFDKTKRFCRVLTEYGSKNYYQFDFNLSPQTLYNNIEQFIHSYECKQSENNFQCFNIQTEKRQHQQYFIPRVNCLDCIDRTNVICSRIGQSFVKKTLKILNITYTQTFHQKYLNHWKNLGNQISLIYCGTPSVAEHLTLKEEPSYLSSISSTFRSVTRFLNANNSDSWKEMCNSYLLQEHEKSVTSYFEENIAKSLNPSDYCTFTDLDVRLLTWNVGGTSCQALSENDKTLLAQSIFGQSFNQAPGLIFVTLQQIVELSTYNVVSNNNAEAKKKWENAFLSILKEENPNRAGYTYALYFSEAMVGIASFLFVKSSLNHQLDMLYRVKKMFNYEVRRGMGGALGNKGAIVSGFSIHDTTILNIASHFASGDEKRKERKEDIDAVLLSLKQEKMVAKMEKNSDFIFFAGDFNFRLSNSQEEVRSTIKESKLSDKLDKSGKSRIGLLQELLNRDQLKQNYQEHRLCKEFNEQRITFYPTYRYEKNGEQHDMKRKPGWCDRIFYYCRDKYTMEEKKYVAVDQVRMSDHRAVVGSFSIKIKVENKAKKHQLIDNWFLSNSKNQRSNKVIQEPRSNLPIRSRYAYQ